MSWICHDVRCRHSGRDGTDGYPVCTHPEAYLHASPLDEDSRTKWTPATESGYEHGDSVPQVTMDTCPLNLWRFSGSKRIPVTQSLLVEYQGD